MAKWMINKRKMLNFIGFVSLEWLKFIMDDKFTAIKSILIAIYLIVILMQCLQFAVYISITFIWWNIFACKLQSLLLIVFINQSTKQNEREIERKNV